MNRLFGRFTWNQYSPAGSLERSGFLWRQLRRRRERDLWTFVGYGMWAVAAIPFAIGIFVLVTRIGG